MTGRNRYSPYENPRGYPPKPPPPLRAPPHPIMLQEELEIQHHEICRLLGENQRLIDDRVAMQRELGATREEIRRMNGEIVEIEAKNEMNSRKLVDKVMKLEADLRATEPIEIENVQLRDVVERLNSIKHELFEQVQTLTKDVKILKDDNKQIPVLREETEELQKELMHARAAIDYEKKGHIELMDQKQAMEDNLISMAREIEKLRAELTSIDPRSWGAGGSYRMNYSTFPHSYGDPYFNSRGVADNGPLYSPNSSSWAELEKSRNTRR